MKKAEWKEWADGWWLDGMIFEVEVFMNTSGGYHPYIGFEDNKKDWCGDPHVTLEAAQQTALRKAHEIIDGEKAKLPEVE